MKRILLTTDFSELADAALGPVASVAKATGAAVTLVHVIDGLQYTSAYPYPDLRRFRAEIEVAVRDALVKTADKLLDLGVNGVETASRVGTPVTEILDIIDNHPEIDLLAMASHGWTGFRRFLIGSVTEALVRAAPCPVLTVHAATGSGGGGDWRPQRIVLATDLSESSDGAVKGAAAWARAFQADIDAVHVFQPPVYLGGLDVPFGVPKTPADIETLRGSFDRAMHKQLERLGLVDERVSTHLLDAPHLAEGIVAHAETQNADLIAVGSHGRRGLSYLALGSVAEKVVRMADRPVIVFKAAAN